MHALPEGIGPGGGVPDREKVDDEQYVATLLYAPRSAVPSDWTVPGEA